MGKNNTTLTKQLIVKYAKQYGVNPYLALALARQESGFGQYDNSGKIKRSSKGALGVMQLMPATAKGLGVNPNNLEENIEGGVRYLKAQLDRYGGNIEKTLAAYNAGPNAVKKYNGVPPYKETQDYVKIVMGNMNGYQKDDSIRRMVGSEYKIANNTNDSNPTLKGGINLDMVKGKTTGAAADMGIQYYDENGNLQTVSLKDMHDLATKPQKTAADLMKDEQIAAEQWINNPTLQKYINRQYGMTPEQFNQYQQNTLNALQNLQSQSNKNAMNYRGMLEDAYQRQLATINSDPRLQNMGYYVDPRSINAQAIGQTMLANLGLGGKYVSAQDLAAMQAQNRLANQYGIDYNTLTAANDARIQRDLAAQTQYGTSLDALIKAAQEGDKTAITELQNIVGKINDVYKTGTESQEKFDQAVAEKLIPLGDVGEQAVTGYNNQITTGMTNAGNTENKIIEGASAQNVAAMNNLTDLQKQQMINQGALDVANVGFNKDVTVAGIGQPAKDLAATGQFYYYTSPLSGYDKAQQQQMFINTLNPNARGVMINPNITPEQYNTAYNAANNITPAPTPTNKPKVSPVSQEELRRRYVLTPNDITGVEG